MQDGAPTYRTKLEKQWLREEHTPVLEWPGNSLDLNPTENAWNLMKNKEQEAQPSGITELRAVLKRLWDTMENEYFEKLANSMPQRSQNVIQAKGFMTKY